MSDWTILGKYPFSLLPGEARPVEGQAQSYYEYLNDRWQETGKNVQCVAWLLREWKPSLITIEEPFGGCGVFSVALQELLQPRHHRIIEIDTQCVEQIRHATARFPGLQIVEGDAHQLAGLAPAAVYVCDFPYFTYTRLVDRGEWLPELRRMAQHRPEAILITDGAACRYHLVAKALARRGLPVTSSQESYAQLLGERLWEDMGYSITGCAWHGTCFYFRAESVPPGPIEMQHFPAGSGPAGLRRA